MFAVSLRLWPGGQPNLAEPFCLQASSRFSLGFLGPSVCVCVVGMRAHFLIGCVMGSNSVICHMGPFNIAAFLINQKNRVASDTEILVTCSLDTEVEPQLWAGLWSDAGPHVQLPQGGSMGVNTGQQGV